MGYFPLEWVPTLEWNRWQPSLEYTAITFCERLNAAIGFSSSTSDNLLLKWSFNEENFHNRFIECRIQLWYISRR